MLRRILRRPGAGIKLKIWMGIIRVVDGPLKKPDHPLTGLLRREKGPVRAAPRSSPRDEGGANDGPFTAGAGEALVAGEEMKNHRINFSLEFAGQLAILMKRQIPRPPNRARFAVSEGSFPLQAFQLLAALFRNHGRTFLLLQFHLARVLRYYELRCPKNCGYLLRAEVRRTRNQK